MRHIWKILLAIAIVVLVVLILKDSKNINWENYQYSNQEENTAIHIGFLAPLTERVTTPGERSLIAAQLAVDEINRAGGINGRAIHLMVEDSQCDEKVAKDAITRLINNDVVAVIGGLCSSETNAIIDTINQEKIPTISYCSSAAELSGVSPYFFRVIPSDIFQARYAANYAKDNNFSNVVIVHVDDPWGTGLAQEFEQSFSSKGGKVLLNYSFDQNRDDFKEVLSKIQELQPELVYVAAADVSTVPLLNQLKNYNIGSEFLGADAWDVPEIWEQIDTPKTFSYVAPKIKEDEEFLNKIQDRGIHGISACYPQAYDAVNILLETLKNETNNPDDIVKQLHLGNFTNTVSSTVPIRFDKNGDMTDAEYELKTIITPVN